MPVATIENVKTEADKDYGPIRLKSYEEVLQDLAESRAQIARGEIYTMGAVTKEIRASHGLL